MDKSYRLIALTQGQITAVDASDFGWLSQWLWYAWWNKNGKCFYAVRTAYEGSRKYRVYMHREIMGDPPGLTVDHEDRDSLNNRRYNLREATVSQNGCNRGPQADNKSGLKGVRWHVRDKVWHATIKLNGKSRHLGTFNSPEAAHEAYKKAAAKLHGEFAGFE